MESIFESLENLNVSEECFDEIMGIVEELINELYPASPKNIGLAIDRRSNQVKRAEKESQKANKELEKSELNKTKLGKKSLDFARKLSNLYKKGDKQRNEGLSDYAQSNNVDKSSIIKKMIKGQEKIDKNRKMQDESIKAYREHNNEKEELRQKVKDTENKEREAGRKFSRVQNLARNHFALKHNNDHTPKRLNVKSEHPKYEIGRNLHY